MKKVKEILKRKITFFFKNLYSDNFDELFAEFGNFVFSTPELTDIVRTIVEAGKVSKSYLEFVIMQFIVSQTADDERGKKIIKPLFYSDKIERKYHLMQEFRELVQSELDAIKRGEKMGVDGTSMFPSHERRKEFYHAEKLYFDIIEEIELRELRATKASILGAKDDKQKVVVDSEQKEISELKFDSVKSALFVGSTKVTVKNHGNQYELLRIVFENPKEAFKEWFYDEIIESYDPTREVKEKTFENAAYQLKNRITVKTGLHDVMEVKKRSVIFNKKYKAKT